MNSKQWAQEQAQAEQAKIGQYENQIAQLTEAINGYRSEINRLTALANQAHGAYVAYCKMANSGESAESASDDTESAQSTDNPPQLG